MARYWSETATFSYPLSFIAPVGCLHWNSGKSLVLKNRIMGLPGSEDSLTISWAVSTQYQRESDRQTDRQTDVQPIWLTHVKNLSNKFVWTRRKFEGQSPPCPLLTTCLLQQMRFNSETKTWKLSLEWKREGVVTLKSSDIIYLGEDSWMSVEEIFVKYRVVVGKRLGETWQPRGRDLLQRRLVRLVTNATHVDNHSVLSVRQHGHPPLSRDRHFQTFTAQASSKR